MKRFISTLLFVLFLTVVNGQTENNFVPGELIVQLDNRTDARSYFDALSKEHGYAIIPKQRLAQSLNLWLVAFDLESIDTRNVLKTLQRESYIKVAQLNHTDLQVRNTPNDIEFDEQWPLYNDGTNGGSGTADIDALNAWDITTGGVTDVGDSIVVAVIDGGFKVDHADLEENIFTNHNEIPGNGQDDDNNGYVDDVHGWNVYNNSGQHSLDNHGTHVAGTIGAVGNNGIGVVGVNWKVKVLPVTGSSSLESTVVAAYGYVLDMRKRYNQSNGTEGAYVVSTNSSFGVDWADPANYPIWCGMYDSLGYAGVISAGATANNNVNIDVVGDVPTACGSNFLLSVTNTTSSDTKNNGAGYGATTIDLGAPGTNVHSTTVNGYGSLTGTSMATPHVAGTIALMYSALCSSVFQAYAGNPAGLALYVKNKLLSEGVDQIGALNGKVVTGGRLNLYKAVESVADSCTSIQLTVTNSSCGDCNGGISAQVFGGQPPYQYYWSNSVSGVSTISGLCAGNYALTVVDDNDDSSFVSTSISDSSGPVVTFNAENVSCPNGDDGTVVLSGANAYLWSDGNTSHIRNDLEPGTYFVSASELNNPCTTIVEIIIGEPQGFNVTHTYTMPVPLTASNGTIDISVNGANPPYVYAWSTGDVDHQVVGLSTGIYTVTITDDDGCTMLYEVMLEFPEGYGQSSQNSLSLYPNPTKGELNLVTPFAEGFDVSIIDITGRVVFLQGSKTSTLSLNIPLLNSGIYTVLVASEGEVVPLKLELLE